MNATWELSTEIKSYEALLRPFAFNLTKSKEETEDLIQDTFYRALANREKFSEGTNFKAWLFTIMRNIFINNYRRKQKGVVVSDVSKDGFIINNAKTVDRNRSERSFLAEDIQKAMSMVNEDFTAPFLMYHNGFHYQEIAEQLNLPLGTVKSRIFSARKELQERLKALGVTNSIYNN
ncbi:MAG: RNA polymerase sigma factor [Chitinophagales bacterium]